MRAGLSKKRVKTIVEVIEVLAPQALKSVADALPQDFPPQVVDTVLDATKDRLRELNLPLN